MLRCILSRSQEFVKVHDFNWGQMGVSECNGNYEFVFSAREKAKSVTNNLPILSVLCIGVIHSFCLSTLVIDCQ